MTRASGRSDNPGDIVSAKIDLVMSHENSLLVLKPFREMGAKRIWDESKVVVLFDHRVPGGTPSRPRKATERSGSSPKKLSGDEVAVDLESGTILRSLPHLLIVFKPLPEFLIVILMDGGLVAHIRKRFSE